MKYFNTLLVLLIFSACTLAITSCGNKSKSDKSNTEVSGDVDKTGMEYTSAYVCPMHCKGSGSDKAGKCPVCEMDYVKNKDHKDNSHDGHNHDGHDHSDHNHDGHDHSDHNH